MWENEIKCPICEGSGRIESPKPEKKMADKIKYAKSLKKAGFSFREIMKLMEYKSTRSVSYLLQKTKLK